MNTQQLKELAQRATGGVWRAFINEKANVFSVHTPEDQRCGDIIDWMGFDGVDCSKKQKARNARFIAASNPDTVIALIEQLEAAERERDKLRDRLNLVREQRDAELNKNSQLEAELARRDAAAGEAVEYQSRTKPVWDSRAGWSDWEKCSKGSYSDIVEANLRICDWCYEVRKLYTTPPAASVHIQINDDMALAFHHATSDGSIGSDDVTDIKSGLAAAFASATLEPAASMPDGLAAAVNRLLDSDGSRGTFSAIRRGNALAEVERLLAAAPAPGGDQ